MHSRPPVRPVVADTRPRHPDPPVVIHLLDELRDRSGERLRLAVAPERIGVPDLRAVLVADLVVVDIDCPGRPSNAERASSYASEVSVPLW